VTGGRHLAGFPRGSNREPPTVAEALPKPDLDSARVVSLVRPSRPNSQPLTSPGQGGQKRGSCPGGASGGRAALAPEVESLWCWVLGEPLGRRFLKPEAQAISGRCRGDKDEGVGLGCGGRGTGARRSG